MNGAMRLGRGLVVAVVIVIISAALHTAGGGCLDHFTSLGFFLLTASTTGLAIALSNREWTVPRLFALVAVAQLAFHGLFEVLDRWGNHTSLITQAAHGHHGASMWSAHLGAAAIIVLILRRGERWLLAFGTLLAGLLPRTVYFFTLRLPTPVDLPQAPKDSGLRRILLSSVLSRRGPPFVPLAFAPL